MKSIYILLCLLALPFLGMGQFTIRGEVVDPSHKPLEFANALLYAADTSTFLQGAVVDAHGQFTLTAMDAGNYLLEISMLGFAPVHRPIRIQDAPVDLGTIQLLSDEALLETVTVIAKKPLFERQADRTVVNIREALTASGGTALEMLEKSPGMLVDRVGNNLSLMGKSIVVAVNGKRVRLEDDALLQYLASISNENIERIELIDNPPASYDAQGAGGVVNIILRENEEEGTNGNLSLFAGYGERPKFGGNFNIYFRRGRWNLYADLSSTNDWTQQDYSLQKHLFDEGQAIYTDQYGDRPAYIANHSARIGADLSISRRIRFSTYATLSKRIWAMDALATTQYEQPVAGATEEFLASNESNQTEHYMTSNNLSIQLSETQHLSFDYDYLNYKIENPTSYVLDRLGPVGDTVELGRFSSGKLSPFDFHVIKADYENRFSPKLVLQAGAKATLSRVSNSTELRYQFPETGIDPFFTDEITLDEQILAAYVSGTYDFSDKTQLTAGLRFEQLNFELNSTKEGLLIDRITNRLFPSLAFSHQFSDTRKVTLSFNQRIDRPGFQILAPAFYFLDVNTLLAGNINALPTISTTTTLGLTLGTLNLSVAYTDEDQPLAGFQPITNSENNLVVFQSVNIEDNDLVTASLVFPWEVTDFWTARFNLLANWRRAETLIDAMPVVNKGWAYFLNTTQSFQIGENLGIELTGRYNSKVVVGLSTFLPRISFDLAVRKTFANKSKLSLSWLDLFNQGSYFALLQDDPQRDIYYNWKYELEGNILRLTYSMPFGNSHLKTKPQRRAGSEEVQQRATN